MRGRGGHRRAQEGRGVRPRGTGRGGGARARRGGGADGRSCAAGGDPGEPLGDASAAPRRLRRALGDHVAQRGSLVAPDRLRFDFAHPRAMSPQEIAAVEAEVNDYVRQNAAVETRIMTPDSAEKLGARALFGEKYWRRGAGGFDGDGGRQRDRCGQGHPIRSSSAAARMSCVPATSARSNWFPRAPRQAACAGSRRLTGAGALAHVAAGEAALAETAGLLRARPEEVPERVRALIDERRAQSAEIAELRRRAGNGRRPGRGGGAGDRGRGAVPGAEAQRRVGQGFARADRRAQGAAGVGG